MLDFCQITLFFLTYDACLCRRKLFVNMLLLTVHSWQLQKLSLFDILDGRVEHSRTQEFSYGPNILMMTGQNITSYVIKVITAFRYLGEGEIESFRLLRECLRIKRRRRSNAGPQFFTCNLLKLFLYLLPSKTSQNVLIGLKIQLPLLQNLA
jgi:hypothetical protein